MFKDLLVWLLCCCFRYSLIFLLLEAIVVAWLIF